MAQQWLSASDPFFSQYPGTYDESGYVSGPYDPMINGLRSPQNWETVATQLGWTGPTKENYIGPDGNVYEKHSDDFLRWISSKQAEGYDFVTDASTLGNYNQRFGFRLPSGEVTNQTVQKVSGFGDFFKEFVLPAVGIAFGMGGFNSLMGGAGAGANALSGAGLGAMEGVGLSGNIINAATGQTIASLPTAAMTAADIGRGLGDVLGQVNQPPVLETTNFAPLENAVANVTTPAAQLTDASNAMQLRPLTQLQPITQTPNALAGIEGLAGVPVDPAFAAGMGVDAGMAALAPATGTAVGAAGGKTALEALGGSLQAGGTPGALGSALGSTTAALATGAGAAMTGIPFLDKAIDFVTTPAGAAIVSGVGNVVGGIAAGSAAKDAAQTQAEAADKALGLQTRIYEDFLRMNAPFYEAGKNALGQITRGEITAEPGYGFRLGEGMKALERLQASRGNLLSGGAMKAGQRYAQDLASQEYDKSFNRLAQIAGFGTGATSRAGEAGQNYAGQAGELGMQGANALVSGRIGRTSAYTSGAKGAINALQGYQAQQRQDQLLNRMLDIYGRTGG
jgi:hypothetical protein